jgi:hypothetical protein
VKEHNMSGFDTSQPATDEAVIEGEISPDKPKHAEPATPPADPDELGDATPGPR